MPAADGWAEQTEVGPQDFPGVGTKREKMEMCHAGKRRKGEMLYLRRTESTAAMYELGAGGGAGRRDGPRGLPGWVRGSKDGM